MSTDVHTRRRGGAAALVAAALLLLPAVSGSDDLPPAAMSAAAPALGTSCPLCAEDPGAPVVRLTPADADSLGRAYSAFNEVHIARLDSLLRAGRLGDPGSAAARRDAHLLARLLTLNAYSYIARYATDSTHVYEGDESTLTDAFARFSDPGLYPIVRLRRARMGLGRVCLRYDLASDLDTESVMGSKRVRVRIREAEIDGRHQRVLAMNLPTGLDEMVEVLMTEHYSCAVEHVQRDGPPGPYELYLVRDVRGGWLRKWGTHQPQALMFWVTPRGRVASVLPAEPLVGVRIYVPHLILKLRLLPDIGFDDLREVDLPQPILSLDWLRARRYPEWLESGKELGFEGWKGCGPVPPELRLRFPDL